MNNIIHSADALAVAYGVSKGNDVEIAPLAFQAGAVIGGLLPDIDTPKSRIGKIIKPLSTIINKTKERYYEIFRHFN